MKYKSRQDYKVLGKWSPEDVLPHTGPDEDRRGFTCQDGVRRLVKMTSLRYQTFVKSIYCACCGIEGTVMLLEMPTNGGRTVIPHFNLYAEREGRLVQMTKDHIQPKSKDGKDHINNMQTMCHICNELKGDQTIRGGNQKTLERLRKIQDGAQTIHLVAPGPYLDDVLEGFATTNEGIGRLVEKHFEHLYPLEKFEIQVDIGEMCVIIEAEDGLKFKYVIHKIKRI